MSIIEGCGTIELQRAEELMKDYATMEDAIIALRLADEAGGKA